MEIVANFEDIVNLKNNQVFGNFELNNSQIRFLGVNNILFCEENVKISNSNIFFRGNNSVIYISSSKYGDFHNVIINIRNDSTIYIGKDIAMGNDLHISVEEHQSFILGDDALIENNIEIRTSESFPIYDSINKNRINYSKSIFIGDHVFLDHFVHISEGTKIGSGAIVGHSAFTFPNSIIPSNTKVLGNPAKIVAKNIFFTKEFTGSFRNEDTKNFSKYTSDVYLFNFVKDETLDINKIDDILKNMVVSDRLEFIKKLFVRNKRRNRFYI